MSGEVSASGQPSAGGPESASDQESAGDSEAELHRRLGKELFNHVWTLLQTEDRTPEQIDEMIDAAHASAWHWAQAGTVANRARSAWQIARVYSTLGRAEPALWHARRCVALADEAVRAGVADDWDVAASLEGLARAQAAAGDRAATTTVERARRALDAIADPEDRETIEKDLDSIGI